MVDDYGEDEKDVVSAGVGRVSEFIGAGSVL